MVSNDHIPRAKAVHEAPISFDGIHTYQLILKNRGLSYLAEHNNSLRQCKVVRMKLDGSTEVQRTSFPYTVDSIGFAYHKNTVSYFRFDGVIKNDNGIDLAQVLSEVKKLSPSTLYVMEMDIKTDSNMILKFVSRQMKMQVVRDRIKHDKNSHDTPLVLKHIYDIETLREIRKEHLGHQLSFILIGEKGMAETTLYKVID